MTQTLGLTAPSVFGGERPGDSQVTEGGIGVWRLSSFVFSGGGLSFINSRTRRSHRPLSAARALGCVWGGGFQIGLLATQSEGNILHFGPIKYSHNGGGNDESMEAVLTPTSCAARPRSPSSSSGRERAGPGTSKASPPVHGPRARLVRLCPAARARPLPGELMVPPILSPLQMS